MCKEDLLSFNDIARVSVREAAPGRGKRQACQGGDAQEDLSESHIGGVMRQACFEW